MKTTAMSRRVLKGVLEKLARSSMGKQGIGKIIKHNHAVMLCAVGLAKSTKESEQKIYALTLNGFRFLESMRWRDKINAARKNPL